MPVPGVVVNPFPITTGVAGLDGKLSFTYQTTNPQYLGFDLNQFADDFPGTTVVTTYSSGQRLQLNPDGSLSVTSS